VQYPVQSPLRSLKPAEEGTPEGAALHMSPDYYRDLTPPLRLCVLLLYLQTGAVLRPAEYANRLGIRKETVYGQIHKLELIQPIVRLSGKGWQLMKHVPKPDSEIPEDS
jgi:hypothetical protein